jgi:hypothetical protein
VPGETRVMKTLRRLGAFVLLAGLGCGEVRSYPDENKDERWAPILKAVKARQAEPQYSWLGVEISTPEGERAVRIFSDKKQEITFIALCYPADKEETKRAFEYFTSLGADFDKTLGQQRPCALRGVGINAFVGKIGRDPRWATQLTLNVFRDIYQVPDDVKLAIYEIH